MGARRAAKATKWQRRVIEWRASGISQAAFCRKRRWVLATFRWWRKRLDYKTKEIKQVRNLSARSGVPPVASGHGFIPVRLKTDLSDGGMRIQTAAWACEFVVRGGVKIRLRECPNFKRLCRITASLKEVAR